MRGKREGKNKMLKGTSGAPQSGVNMSFISEDEQGKIVVLLHRMVAEDVHS